MPTQHVPPDRGNGEQISTELNAARIGEITETLREFLASTRGVDNVRIAPATTTRRITGDDGTDLWIWEDEPITSVIPAPIPEETTAPVVEPVRERYPRDTVWIMSTPTRRGPGRVSDVRRSNRWRPVFEQVSVYGILPQGTARYSNGYTIPSQTTGTTRTYRWWFLGWHPNGNPMYAVRMSFAISNDEGETEIRRAIRERIGETITRYRCHFCYNAYPATDQWPIPRGDASQIYLTGYGSIAVCGGCAVGMEACAQPGCRERGRVEDMVAVRVNAIGTISARFCQSHAATVVRCIHCQARFASPSVHNEHNCTGSDLNWERCSVCNNQTRVWELVTYTDGTRQAVCSEMHRRCMRGIRRCHLCQGYTRQAVIMADASSLVPNYPLCAECAEREGVDDCEHCGANFPAVDAHDCHTGGRCRCDMCMGRVIRSYSYKPKPRFKGRDRHGLFLGMELEIFVDRNRDVHEVARAVQADLGRVGYIKSDGSISHGFEIVTHPMSYEYAMSEFPWHVLKTLDDHGSFATDGSGIHVHASRKGFNGAAHEYRWMIFLHRNQRQAQIIARRISTQWASFSSDQRHMAKDIATKKTRDGNRYRAINQTNTDTIEIRIFESSTDEQTVRGTLGFVHASIEYARAIRARDVLHDDAWGWKAFAKWVKARPEYAALYAEMVRLNVAGDTDAEPTYGDPRNGNRPSSVPVRFTSSDDDCGCDPDLIGCGCGCGGHGHCNGRCVCSMCDGECYDSSDEDW